MVFPAQRDAIKSIQFGLIYGRTAYGLAEVLNIGTDEAERLIASTLSNRLPGAMGTSSKP